MKTIKLTVAAALIAVATTVTAVERPEVNLIPVNAGQAVVSVKNENAAYFELGIYTSRGGMVYYKQTNEQVKDYRKVYDFTNLAKGNYIFSLKVNDTQVTKDFEVTATGIKVGKQKVSYDPYFNFENNELKFSYLNFEREDLKLLIYNNEGLVYEKNLGNEFSVTKGLDLSSLNEGSYFIVLNSLDKEFSFNIVK